MRLREQPDAMDHLQRHGGVRNLTSTREQHGGVGDNLIAALDPYDRSQRHLFIAACPAASFLVWQWGSERHRPRRWSRLVCLAG
jgi:hypothetical protein